MLRHSFLNCPWTFPVKPCILHAVILWNLYPKPEVGPSTTVYCQWHWSRQYVTRGSREKQKKRPKALLKRKGINRVCPEAQGNMCMEVINHAAHTLKPFNCFQLSSTLWFPATALCSALHIKMLLWLFKILSSSLSRGLSLHAIISPSGSIRKWHSRTHLSLVR